MKQGNDFDVMLRETYKIQISTYTPILIIPNRCIHTHTIQKKKENTSTFYQ